MKNPANMLRREFLLLSGILFFASTNNLIAQTTWTGASSTAWNTAGNWSAGVPDATDDVTIPNVTNDPVISVAGAVAKSVAIQAGGLLSINAAGTLTINGSASNGLDNQGTVQNNGTIHIGNTSAVAGSGILNQAVFNNNSGAQINIDRVSTSSIAGAINNPSGGSFTNAGTITIGAIAMGGGNGLYNSHGGFNNSSGVVNISNVTDGIRLTYGTVTNSGTINIGPAGSATIARAIYFNYGTFNNATGGQININRASTGFYLYEHMTNSGAIIIGAETAVPTLFQAFDIYTFTNNTGGIFKGSGNIPSANFINAGGTLEPGNALGTLAFNAGEDFTNSIIKMDVNGAGTAGVNFDQISVGGLARLGGTLNVSINYIPTPGDQMTIFSAGSITGTFSSVTGLPANWYVNYTPVAVILSYQPLITNTWTGSVNTDWNNAGNWSQGIPTATSEVTIPNVANDPEISNNTAVAKSVSVQSGGILTIGATGVLTVNGGSIYGVWNKGSLINWGTLRIGNTSSVGFFGIYNENIIQNFLGCSLEINRVSTAGIVLMSGNMNNAGTVTIGSLVPVTNLMTGDVGTFSNNGSGIVKGTGNIPSANFTNNGGTLSPGYSPGQITFNGAETFTNSTMAIEINGFGNAGVNWDYIAVSGTATLGGTLNVSVNYAGSLADQFTILTAAAVTGTFSNVTGLPPGWNVAYYPSSVVVIYGLPVSTWTGAVSTAWNTAGNWSHGVPNLTTDAIIPNVTNDPVISTTGINVKSVTVQTGGLLTITAAGVLNINRSSDNGFLNQGTVQNNGTIHIGNTFAVAGSGILNQAVFNNNSGAQINIDRVSTSSIAGGINNPSGGSFTNAGTITIGAIAMGGGNGIYNSHGGFNNSSGVVNISNVTDGIRLTYGSVTNSGTINIGPAGSATIARAIYFNYGTFNNATGGQININRASTGFYLYEHMTNSGDIIIGAEAAVPTLFQAFDIYTFTNNTGGIFKGSGNIPSANFINAGGTLAPGTSPGKLTFNASENFASSIMAMEVNGTGTAGVHYDQVAVNGTATLGGTLALSINYAGVQGNQVTLVSAAAISGTFSSITGLLPNWKVTYTATSVLLTYDVTTTWTGAISSAWNTPGNWTNGVPTASSIVIIPNVTIDPVISVAGANALTVHVQAGAILSIMNTGSLTTHGVATFNAVTTGLYNQGTVHNSGILTINKQ